MKAMRQGAAHGMAIGSAGPMRQYRMLLEATNKAMAEDSRTRRTTCQRMGPSRLLDAGERLWRTGQSENTGFTLK